MKENINSSLSYLVEEVDYTKKFEKAKIPHINAPIISNNVFEG